MFAVREYKFVRKDDFDTGGSMEKFPKNSYVISKEGLFKIEDGTCTKVASSRLCDDQETGLYLLLKKLLGENFRGSDWKPKELTESQWQELSNALEPRYILSGLLDHVTNGLIFNLIKNYIDDIKTNGLEVFSEFIIDLQEYADNDIKLTLMLFPEFEHVALTPLLQKSPNTETQAQIEKDYVDFRLLNEKIYTIFIDEHGSHKSLPNLARFFSEFCYNNYNDSICAEDWKRVAEQLESQHQPTVVPS